MALASLTVDLTLALAKFESDSGKAAQIITRDTEKMSAGARAFERQLERMADQAGRTQGQFLALRAAELGLGENSKAAKLIDQIERQGAATAAVSAEQVAGIKAVQTAAEASAERQKALQLELVQSILKVNAAYEQRRAQLIAQEKDGAITPDQLKTGLAGLGTQRQDSINQLKAAAAAERQVILQTEARAAAERAAADASAAAARRIIDAQNGISASYREQLRALRQLRDEGQITPQQFRAAGTELVKRQPVAQQAAEEIAANEKRRQSAAQLIDTLNGLGATYRRNLQILQSSLSSGQISPAQFQTSLAALNAQRPDVQRFKAEQAEAAAAIKAREAADEKAAEAAEANARRQAAAAQAIVDQQNGLSASYRERLKQLRELRDAEAITPAQFRRAGTELVNQQPGVAAAKKAAQEIADSEKKKADAAKKAADEYVAAIQRQADAIGKTRSELILEEAARRGVLDQVRPFVERIDAAEKNLNKFGRTSGIAKYQLLTLQYTISDVAASLASGISPFTILLQQGGQVADVFAGNGGVGAIFRTLGSIITPVRVAVGGLAGALAGVAFAAYEGARQTKEVNDAIVLTGNFAGQTEASVRSMVRQIASGGQVQVTSAREAAVALLATGEISAKGFDVATEAAARFSTATGKTAKEVAQQFAEVARNPTEAAQKLNQAFNILTVAQFEQIRGMQESGRSAEAASIVYEALNTRLKQLEPNLGVLDRALRTTSGWWKNFWDAAYDIGRPETIDDKLSAIEKRIEEAQRKITLGTVGIAAAQLLQLNPSGAIDTIRGAADKQQLDALQDERNTLLRQKGERDAAAAVAAEQAKANKETIESSQFVEGFLKRSKAVEGLTKALAEAQRHFDNLEKRGKPVPQATQESILKKIREDFTDKSADTEAQQVRRQELEQGLKFLQQRLQDEKDAIAQSNQEEQALYNAGLTSLQDFYARRNAVIDKSVQDELNALTDRQAVLELYRDDPATDPSERVRAQTQINEAIEEGARIVARAAGARKVSDIEQAQAFVQLTQRVNEYRAQLLQLEGDEAGAARLRTQSAIQSAQILSRQSGGTISTADVERQQRALDAATEYAEVQRRVGIATADAARAEELYLLVADQGGASLLEREQAVYLIRNQTLEQLKALADRARAAADASTDPKIKAFADDLALQYAKAADAVDPALNRLRAAGKELGSNLASDFASAVTSAQKFSDILPAISKSIQGFAIKTLITQPLEQFLQNGIRDLIDARAGGNKGGGLSGGAVVDQVGAFITGRGGADGSVADVAGEAAQQAALAAQTAATVEATGAQIVATSSLGLLSTEAYKAALALAAMSATEGTDAAGNILSAVFGAGGGGVNYAENPFAAVALADGTNRVPYDGFKATLHKNEAVVPAKYNPAAGGAQIGARPQVIINAPPGTTVARQEERNGGAELEVWLEAAVSEVERRMAAGGSTDRVMRSTYGVRRNLPRRD